MRAHHVFVAALFACSVHAHNGLDLRAEGDQGLVMVRAYPSTDLSAAPLLQATWRFPAGGEPTFDLQRLAAPDDALHLSLDRLLLTGVEQYLDLRVHFEKTGVRTDVPVERLVADINAMVRGAAAELGASAQAEDLSSPTREQLARVAHIDWSQARFGVDGGADQDKYLAIYYYVRTQRQELERQLRADLLTLVDFDVLTPATGATNDPGHTVEVPTVCRRVFDDQNFLCALDLTASDSGMAPTDAPLDDKLLANIAAQAHAAEAADAPKLRKRDRWLKAEFDHINARIGEIDQRKELWALRDRLDDMQTRIADLGNDVQELRSNSSDENPIADLSALTQRNLVVRFAKGSSEVEEQYKGLLSEIFEQLARAPQYRVLITGFTDRSGDDAMNMAISEARAKAVRAYLMQRGIAGERLLVNYYGSTRSLGIDPDERRVEIEWLR